VNARIGSFAQSVGCFPERESVYATIAKCERLLFTAGNNRMQRPLSEDARIISRKFADTMRPFATMLYFVSQRLPNPVALRFARSNECGALWLQLAATANIVQRSDDEAR
jgi:hypothetical protein